MSRAIRLVGRLCVCVVMLVSAFAAFGQSPESWPTKPLRIVVPYPAGGGIDVFARQFAEAMSSDLKQPVVVENRPGGMGLIGARAVSQGPADNHTVLAITSQLVTLRAMGGDFDVLKELKPVIRLTATPSVCAVPADSPWKSMADLVAAVRAKPGEVRYATAGTGSPAHMAVLYLESAIGDFKALQIPYKGGNESVTALLGGQIDFSIVVLVAAVTQINAGRLRALGVSSRERVVQLPEVPTIAEALGRPYVYESWNGVAMHRDTPDHVVARVEAAFRKAMGSPGVKALLASTGTFADVSASPAAFASSIRDDIIKEGEMFKRLGTLEK